MLSFACADCDKLLESRVTSLAKRMSKTLAAEIADRALEVINPQNRALALRATLGRHGFSPTATTSDQLAERSALIAWLLSTYARQD